MCDMLMSLRHGVASSVLCYLANYAFCMFTMQVLGSQLHCLANRNAELAVPELFCPVNCMKIEGHVTLSGPTVHSLYCGE